MICDRLFERVRSIWEGYLKHPFITGISDGSLDVEKFRYYLLQDYLYLIEYVKVYALGVSKARSLDEMRSFARAITGILDSEMDIHKSYMLRLGISDEEVKNAKPALSNSSYTSYMLAEAAAGESAEIVAAILSCSWSYAYIGQHIANTCDAINHPLFGQWVEGYSAKGYDELNVETMAFMDRLASRCDEKSLGRLEDIFVRCSLYEAAFWDMAWNMEPPPC